ncbi:helix-turn-helix domain-containing protein [Pectobacterium brasiliense]|uniref:helix-turn-helix domain-containing protein n=1 Tax=Pectobacterium brasiliense TaxID=180957 RepID=UPI00057D50A2|nr:helix-turn-helix transcriptional regulator [Pectobacterium brasiliense]KHS71446.1 transcriptional regulator [Pectobacterium brasiliense]MBN3125476.1 helix-turn-helix transcriptional regulator [Pectobacterium brasiliense]MBN3255940.1 helix-turn-helix transcriptional regulator [Pectobacterium brasiliense]MDY4323522.1 helix-turn-helix transcriptional regulator [Pectobacterium brasiliense]QSD22665.1 helix-turn-helix transcriptional regulator [Pectobacterium brasiliense]
MNTRQQHRDIFSQRLKDARLLRGLSQKGLGIAAGIDEFVASARINRYEKGVHEANLVTASRLAEALDVPLAYFYAADDKLARMILTFAELSAAEQTVLLNSLENK